jgi:hypothetical protein
MEYETPTVESFEEAEILGDAPEATGTHFSSGSVVAVNGA